MEKTEAKKIIMAFAEGFNESYSHYIISEDVDRFLNKQSKIQNIGSELGVLDAPAPSHGDLLAVGESHASDADSTEDNEQTSAGTLGKIILGEKDCNCLKVGSYIGVNEGDIWRCSRCDTPLQSCSHDSER